MTPSPTRPLPGLGRPTSGAPPQPGSGAPPPESADPLPEELRDPVLPLPDLASLGEGADGDEPSLVSEVLAAAASQAYHVVPSSASPALGPVRPVPILDSGPAAGRGGPPAPAVLPVADAPSAALRVSPAPGPSAPSAASPPPAPASAAAASARDASAPAPLPVDISAPALLYDIEAAAQRLLGADLLPQKAPPPAERDRHQLLFDRRRGRIFTGLWISVGLISIGVLVGWATRSATTQTMLKRRLGEGERLAATGRYEDLRAARDLYQQAARLAPHDALTLALGAEAEARLGADHGEGTEDSAFILLGRAQHEARKGQPARAAGPLRRAQMLLSLSRGEPCPTFGEAEESRSQREDGDVAARCAVQRGDVAGALRLISSGGPATVEQLLLRGALALSLGDLDEADHAYRTVLDLLPNHPRALLGRGMVVAERGGDPQPAPPPEGVALGVVGESWWQILRGLSALRRGDEPAAKEALELAGRGARYDARLGLWYGRARLDEGRVADAEAALRRAARLSPSDPDLGVLDAEVALAKGHEDRVIRTLSQAMAAPGHRASGRLLSVLGRALYRAGRYREAQDALDRAIAGRPGDLVGQSYRLLCRARLGGERDAFRELEQLSQGALPVTTPHYALSVLAYERKDLERAAKEASQALVRNPEASWARALRGRVLREQGRIPDAIADLERVSREAPALMLSHQLLGRMYLDLGRAREARAELQKVIESSRATLEDYGALIDATLALGLGAEAEQLAREAQKRGASPGKLRRVSWVMASYRGQAQAQQAARDLDAERRKSPREVPIALHAAAAWLRAGDGQSALDIYATLRTRAPLQAHLGGGRALLRLHRGEEAEAAFRAALAEWAKAPYGKMERAEARGGLCRALALRKAFVEASQEAEAALADAPDLSDGHYCRSKVLKDRGDLQAALTEAERAAALDPNGMEACVLLGDVTYRLRRPEARARYERCLQLEPNSKLGAYVRGALSMIK